MTSFTAVRFVSTDLHLPGDVTPRQARELTEFLTQLRAQVRAAPLVVVHQDLHEAAAALRTYLHRALDRRDLPRGALRVTYSAAELTAQDCFRLPAAFTTLPTPLHV